MVSDEVDRIQGEKSTNERTRSSDNPKAYLHRVVEEKLEVSETIEIDDALGWVREMPRYVDAARDRKKMQDGMSRTRSACREIGLTKQRWSQLPYS
jgi:hypothetical protein